MPRPRWTGALALFAGGALLRLPAFTRPLLSDDEAIYAATAAAMARGEQLYRDVVDHKPPAIYHLYRAGAALFGDGDAHGAHLLVLLAVLATGALLWRLADGDAGRRRPAGSAPDGLPPVGAIAAGLFFLFSTTWHDYDALAANCELFLLLPQTAAALLLLRVVERPPSSTTGVLGRHLLIGLLIGLSALCKYQGLTFLGVSAGVLGWAAVRQRITLTRAAAALVVQVGASLLPAALYLGWTTAERSAAATVFWFSFNFSYVGAGLQGTNALRRGLWRLALIGGVAVVPYAFGLHGAIVTGRTAGVAIRLRWLALRHAEGRPTPPEPTLEVVPLLATLWLATSAVAVATGGRFFGHYFHLLLPPLSVLAAPRVIACWRGRTAWRGALVVLSVIPAVAFLLLATVGRPLAEAYDDPSPPYAGVVARIAALSGPDDRIFVWGNSPQLYVLSRRPLGSRFTFCNYMTGESPGTPTETGSWNADRSSLPAAWDMLFADLDQRRPHLFVDAAAAGWDGYDKFPLSRYPRLRAYVEAHYRRVETVSGVEIYRRRG